MLLGFLRVVPILLLGSGTLGHVRPEPGRISHPIASLMGSVTWRLRPELRGVHPRVFVTDAELDVLRERARTTHRELWREVTRNLGALAEAPPAPPAQGRREQNTVAIRLAEAAFAYAIDRDPRYLAAAKEYMDAAIGYDVWGYTYNKPNVDLAAGHLLYGLATAYDLLYDDLTPEERQRCRDKLVLQGNLLYASLLPEPGRAYPYAQNHLFIPVAGLAVAGYALQGEAPEADDWSRLARALYDRVLATYSPDGYYYEGIEYWIFSTPWIVHFLDAHAHATGEDLYDRAPGLRAAHLYLAHEMLPGADDAFDFGDAYNGPLTRTGQDEDWERTHPDGRYLTNYNLLYRLAARYHSADAQGVAQFLADSGQADAEDFWSLVWYDPSLPATPMAQIPTWHHFPDHDVVYWRSGWDDDATAFAFKCGPPEGHAATELLARFPEWDLSAGHAHPDANSFILFARGETLLGDSGYAGIPRADQHNTLLFDGHGQAAEGASHDAFTGYPYALLDEVRIVDARLGPSEAFVQGDATTAYDPAVGVRRFVRSVRLTMPDTLVVSDDVVTSRPMQITSLLHADEVATIDGEGVEIEAGDARLRVDVEAPPVSIEVEPNRMVGPGMPGSIAEGEEEARGERVRFTPLTPATHTKLTYRMRFGEK